MYLYKIKSSAMLYQFKIQIRGIKKPPVWRRILVPGHFTFDDFHRVIQAAFSWNDEHLYQFGYAPYDRDLNISVPQDDDDDWSRPTYDSRILTLEKFFSCYCYKSKLCYVYDFGEDWIHDLTLEDSTEEEFSYAFCTDGKSSWSEDETIGYEDEELDIEDEWPRPNPEGFSLKRVNNSVMAVKHIMVGKKEKKKPHVLSKPVVKHKIYPVKWMRWQPYSKQTNIDQYYIEIANRVLEVLDGKDEYFSFWGIGRERREDMAMSLSQWFQDVVAQGGIWTAFIRECKKRYGSYLPFYPIDEEDYYDDEVNLVDVQFLTWHYIQHMHENDSVINPENFGVNEIANEVYEIFDSEFENAPINDDWHDALHPKTFNEPLLYSFREYLYKLIDCDYLCLNVYESITAYTEEVLSDLSKIGSAQDIIHDYITSLLFEGEENLIGMSLSEWGKEILRLENEKIAQRLDTIRTLPVRLYMVSDVDKKYFHLVDYNDMKVGDATDTDTYKVLKDSFGLYPSNAYQKGQSLVLCRLTSCEGEWNMNGASFVMPIEEYDKKPLDIPIQYTIPHSQSRMLYEKFMEITGGKAFVFPKDKKEAIAFYESLVGVGSAGRLPSSAGNDIVIFASPINGIGMSYGISRWLKTDDNPRYDKEEAMECGFSIICKQNLPYEVASKMYDMGMIDDAAMKSAKGYDYGRKFLQDNVQFFMDYFLRGKG